MIFIITTRTHSAETHTHTNNSIDSQRLYTKESNRYHSQMTNCLLGLRCIASSDACPSGCWSCCSIDAGSLDGSLAGAEGGTGRGADTGDAAGAGDCTGVGKADFALSGARDSHGEFSVTVVTGGLVGAGARTGVVPGDFAVIAVWESRPGEVRFTVTGADLTGAGTRAGVVPLPPAW